MILGRFLCGKEKNCYHNLHICRDGGIGIRVGLKIQ